MENVERFVCSTVSQSRERNRDQVRTEKNIEKNLKYGSNKIVLYFELDGIECVELLIVALKSNRL